MAAKELFLKRNAAMLQAEAQGGAPLSEFDVEFDFEGVDLLDQNGDLWRHLTLPRCGMVANSVGWANPTA